MYAVVDIAGKQVRVAQKDTILVPTLKEKIGAAVKFDRVLLIAGEKNVSIGNPHLTGASVEGTIVDHVRGEKLVVFKKKRRKGYRVMKGHRQGYTKVEITTITP